MIAFLATIVRCKKWYAPLLTNAECAQRMQDRKDSKLPAQCLLPFHVQLPIAHAAVPNTRASAQPPCLCPKLQVTKKTANVLGYLVKGDVKMNEAIT
jgi:hypothetical protein